MLTIDEMDLIEKIKGAYIDAGDEFYEAVWREKIFEGLEESSRYHKLHKWCEEEAKARLQIANFTTPADRNEKYTNGKWEIYKKNIGEFALLMHCDMILQDPRSTKEMRQNIEYALGKEFGIKWSDFLKTFI